MSSLSSSSNTSYSNTVGGSLKLKVSLKKKKDKKRKKEKKKKKKSKKRKYSRDDDEDDETLKKQKNNNQEEEEEEEEEEQGIEIFDQYLTPAERRFKEVQKKRARENAAKVNETTHREKISKFNNYLSSLSEIHDVPRVANAGLG